MRHLETKYPKKTPIFFCETCDFNTSNKKDYKRHIETIKHKNGVNSTKTNILEHTLPQKPLNSYICANCGKEYKSRSGIYAHKKKCNIMETTKIDNKLVMELIQENKELKHFVMEQSKQQMEQSKQMLEIVSKTNNGTITMTNNSNNTNNFNLNFFLNEKCKDALNIMEFVNSLKLQLKDLEETGKLGFVEGISKIFINGLKDLDIHKRPIHCSDYKREVLYVKDEDKWEKESVEKDKIVQAIKTVTTKNIQQIPEWTKKNPSYKDSSSKKNDEYLHMIMNVVSGSNEDEIKENTNKIIRNISKEVVIK
jgi:hypothetical protein